MSFALYAVNKDTSDLDLGFIVIAASSEKFIEPRVYGQWASEVNSGSVETAIDNNKLRIKVNTVELDKQSSKDILSIQTSKIRVSSTDKNYDYLISKLNAGTGISIEEYDAGSGNKKAKITSDALSILNNKIASSIGESYTTSSSWQTKISTSHNVSGTFILHGSCLFSNEDTGVLNHIRISVGGTGYGELVQELYNFKYEDGAYQSYHYMFSIELGGYPVPLIKLEYHSTEDKRMYIKEAYIWLQKIDD